MRPSLIFGSLLLLPLTGGASIAGERVCVSLQVRSSFHGYRAEDVREFLSDPGYLGAIDPALTSASDGSGVPPAGVVSVIARTPANEIVTLEMIGGEGADVGQAMRAVLEHLLAVTPSAWEEAARGIEVANEVLAKAEGAYEAAKKQRLAYIEQHGASDPSVALAQVDHSLSGKRSELDNARADQSAESALREYLVEVMSVAGLTDGEREQLESELRQLRADYDQVKLVNSPKHPAYKRLLERIREVSDALDRAVLSQEAKAQRRTLAAELFDVERRLAVNRSRSEQLEVRTAELAAHAKELSMVEGTWIEVEREYSEATHALREARDRVMIAEHNLGPLATTPWLRILAGPTSSGE